MGNRGTFTKSLKNILLDFEFAYHMGYMIVCMLGLCLHEFFYSLLVGAVTHVTESAHCQQPFHAHFLSLRRLLCSYWTSSTEKRPFWMWSARSPRTVVPSSWQQSWQSFWSTSSPLWASCFSVMTSWWKWTAWTPLSTKVRQGTQVVKSFEKGGVLSLEDGNCKFQS